jgi:hypothetical protein
MNSTETYIIILWRQLRYMSVILCLIFGSQCWLAKTVNSAFKFEVNVCGTNFTHGSGYILFIFVWYEVYNTHALEKISAYFYRAHPCDCINLWPTPSTVLKNSDPLTHPLLFPAQPTPLLLYDWSLIQKA